MPSFAFGVRSRGQPAGQGPANELYFPEEPNASAGSYEWYLGGFTLDPGSFFDDDGFDFLASYAVDPTPPAAMRLGVFMHPSGGWAGVDNVYGVDTGMDITVRTQDGQAKGGSPEWWCYGTDGNPYPQRRIAECIDYLTTRYPAIDTDDLGIVCYGNSMGSGGINASMILPDPWRAKIAYCRGSIGVWMHRRINAENPSQYAGWPPDDVTNEAIWDAVDFELLAVSDAIVRGMHYRQAFSSDDSFSLGTDGISAQLHWVKACSDNKISAVATWVQNGHSQTEAGITFPTITTFEVAQQDVTLDRAHPCFTASTGNYPVDPADITDAATYPRGHYNIGLTWDHANIVDSSTEIIFPIKYTRRTGFGGSIPDQDTTITVSVTPRRPRTFTITNGETIYWSFDSGAQTGSGTVSGDVITATGISLTSGDAFKNLRFYK